MWRQRLLGICGIIGGLTLFAGDMLLYYNNDSTNLLQNMAHSSDNRILVSGVFALLATWFYLLGLVQVYWAFKPVSSLVRNTVIVCFAGILTAYGVVHGAFIAIATSAKLSVQFGLDINTVTALASEVNDAIRLFVYPLFALLSVLFIYQVWKKQTLYPRWIILFFPLVPFIFQSLIGSVLTGNTWVVVMGGFLNLILVLFFCASTVALWHKKT
jgi:hypothetical protein